MRRTLGLTETRTYWPNWKRMLYTLHIPPYWLQPWQYENAQVIRRVGPCEALKYNLLPGYYVEVRLNWYEDMQTHYPSWWKERRGFVRISRRLFRQQFLFDVRVFYQYHRHYNGTRDVRLRIAR